MLRFAAAALLLLAGGCSSPPGPQGDGGPPVATLADFAACPWNGKAGVPDGCNDEAVRLEGSARPVVVGPCLDEVAGGGDFTLRVHRQVEGVAIETAAADAAGREWQAVAVFAEDPTVAYAWTLENDLAWLVLPEAPTTGELDVLFLTYDISSAPASLAQGAVMRWAVEDYGVRPMLAAADDHYFDVGLFPGSPPFVLTPTNLDLVGSDFRLRLEGVQNTIAKLALQDLPINGVGCALPA